MLISSGCPKRASETRAGRRKRGRGWPTHRLTRSLYCSPVARYVIDAPTLLDLVANHVDVHPSNQLVAPNRIRSEALSLLLAAVNQGDITEGLALQQHERLTEIKMRLLGDRVSRRTAWRIARENGWETIFDAEYLAVCTLQADALITIDRELALKSRGNRAARAA